MILLGEEISVVAVDKLSVGGRKSKKRRQPSSANNQPYVFLRYRSDIYMNSIFITTFSNEADCNKNWPPSCRRSELWMMVKSSCQKVYFPNYLVRQKHRLLKQTQSEPLQSIPNFCDLYALYATSHLSKLRLGEITGVHDVRTLSIARNYRYVSKIYVIKVHTTERVCFLQVPSRFFFWTSSKTFFVELLESKDTLL